jgi:hypothetical protein
MPTPPKRSIPRLEEGRVDRQHFRGQGEAFVPDEQAGEGVVVAPDGNMYGAVNVVPRGITKYPKQASRRSGHERQQTQFSL